VPLTHLISFTVLTCPFFCTWQFVSVLFLPAFFWCSNLSLEHSSTLQRVSASHFLAFFPYPNLSFILCLTVCEYMHLLLLLLSWPVSPLGLTVCECSLICCPFSTVLTFLSLLQFVSVPCLLAPFHCPDFSLPLCFTVCEYKLLTCFLWLFWLVPSSVLNRMWVPLVL
jgi:hypothetical protein